LTDARRIRSAMRSGEWLPTQWIARVAFGLGTEPWGLGTPSEHCGHCGGLRVKAPLSSGSLRAPGKGSWPASSSASTFPGVSGAYVRPEYVRPLAPGAPARRIAVFTERERRDSNPRPLP
jgi:hypothetical protein